MVRLHVTFLLNDERCKQTNGASQVKHQQGYRACSIIAFLLLIITGSITVIAQSSIPPIGQWREHLSYQSAIQVVAENEVYCATPNNVFSVDANNEIARFSKASGLNDIGVNAIGFDKISRQLVVCYNNSNIDVVKGSIVKNIGDIKRSNVSGNKTIYSVYCKGKVAYLSSGLGVIVADLEKLEIKDTWQIGNNGGQVKVNSFTSDGANYYAATDEGLKRTTVSNSNPGDYRLWPIIMNGIIRTLTNDGEKTFALRNDSIFWVSGGTIQLYYADASWPITNINASNKKLLICQRKASGEARVLVLSGQGIIEKILVQPGVVSYPREATIKDNAVWVADMFGGLSKFDAGLERYIPNGPIGNASGEMVFAKNKLYIAAGEVNEAWNYQYNRNGIYSFIDNYWDYKGYYNNPVLDSALDFITLATDPVDESVWGGSYGGGLVNFKGKQVKIFKQNSSLQPAIGDPLSYRVSGLAFDHNNNLWISNYGAAKNLSVRKPDGSFKSFTIPFFHFENAISQLLVDDENQLWIVSPRGNGVFVYNPGNNVDNTNDDRWKYLRVGKGTGNLPSNEVFCVAKDKNGFIWIGTAAGIGIVQCTAQFFTSNGCEAILPVVQQDRFAGYLFQNEEVRTIAVDGADRKWIGTRNGVWLISADGEKIIYRFTEDNSPLLSNDIKKIAIDPQTGEVFISTFKGICSFRGTATEGIANNESVLVFPNPVPPNYNGTIAIRGVGENAIVKIAELSGRLVYQTRALGRQAVWNGRNYKGEKVASGVYLVLIKDDTGTERMVTKVVMVGGR